MAELSTIINNKLFKTQTDGMSGDFYVKVEDGDIEFEQKLPEPVVDGYGDLKILGSPTIALTAGDVSLSASYIELNAAGMWSSGGSLNTALDTAGGSITVEHSGTYLLSAYVNVSSDTASKTVGISYKVNSNLSVQKLIGIAKDIGDTVSLSGTSIATLTAGDVVKLAIASDKTSTATIKTGGLTLTRLV